MKRTLALFTALVLCALSVMSAGLFAAHRAHSCSACDCVLCEMHERHRYGMQAPSENAGGCSSVCMKAEEPAVFKSVLLDSDTLTARKVKLTN